jgi:hypothetical protein
VLRCTDLWTSEILHTLITWLIFASGNSFCWPCFCHRSEPFEGYNMSEWPSINKVVLAINVCIDWFLTWISNFGARTWKISSSATCWGKFKPPPGCRSFGAFVTVTILMTDVFWDVMLSLGKCFTLSQILQNIWKHLPSNRVSLLWRFELSARCCGDLKNLTKTS